MREKLDTCHLNNNKSTNPLAKIYVLKILHGDAVEFSTSDI